MDISLDLFDLTSTQVYHSSVFPSLEDIFSQLQNKEDIFLVRVISGENILWDEDSIRERLNNIGRPLIFEVSSKVFINYPGPGESIIIDLNSIAEEMKRGEILERMKDETGSKMPIIVDALKLGLIGRFKEGPRSLADVTFEINEASLEGGSPCILWNHELLRDDVLLYSWFSFHISSILYATIRLNNDNMFSAFMRKCKDQYLLEKINHFLPMVYDEIKLKGVPLSKEMKFLIEDELINWSYVNKGKHGNIEEVITHLDDVKYRIQMISEGIRNLETNYFCDGDKQVDGQFIFIARVIAQNIHVLKKELRSTYDRLPWEEIEFCLVRFIACHTERQEYNFICKILLNRGSIRGYLNTFLKKLNEIKENITKDNINKRFPKVNKSQLATTFNLYKDYYLIKNVYSLQRIDHYVTLALNIDLKNEKVLGIFVIERALQVIGESLKNTLESPNVSVYVHDILLLSAPKNIRAIVINLRDSLSHFQTLTKKNEFEDNNESYFIGIQNDMKKIQLAINEILFDLKLEVVKVLFNKVFECENVLKLKELFLCLNESDIKDIKQNVNSVIMKEHVHIKEMIQDLSKQILNQTAKEKQLFVRIEKVLASHQNMLSISKYNYALGISILDLIKTAIKKDNNFENVKNYSETYLNSIKSKMSSENLKEILHSLTGIHASVESRGKMNDEITKLTFSIIHTIEYDAGRIQVINEFKEVLVKKEYDAETKVKGVFKDIIDKLDESEMYVFEKKLKIKWQNYKNCVGNKRDSYLTLLSSVKNSITNNKPDDLLKCFETFFNSLFNKEEENIKIRVYDLLKKLLNNRDEMVSLFEKRLELLRKLLPDSNNYENHLKIYQNYDQNKKLQAAVEMLVLDITEILESAERFEDAQPSFETFSPMLIGKSLRNYVAHGNALIDILPSDPSMAILSNALKFIIIGKDLLTVVKEPIFPSLGGKLSYLSFPYCKRLEIVANQNDMFTAVKEGDLEKVKSYIKERADIKGTDYKGWSGLHFAAQENKVEVFKFLLGSDLTIDGKDIDGQTSFHVASIFGSIDIIEYLLKKRVYSVSKDICAAIEIAAGNGHLEVLKLLLINAKNISLQIDNLGTVLDIAVKNGYVDMVNYLLESRKPIDFLPNYGTTPLHTAAFAGNVNIIKSLLKKNFELDAKDNIEFTPLHYAALNGHKKVVESLLEDVKGGKLTDLINAKDKDGATPLHRAVYNNHGDVVNTLLERGADPDAKDEKGTTSLHIAAGYGFVEIVEILLGYDADIKSCNKNQYTAIYFAVIRGQVRVFDCLLGNGAFTDGKDEDGNSFLHAAVAHGHEEMVERLLNKTDKINDKNKFGLTPLHIAALNGFVEIMKHLLEKGADVNVVQKDGLTAFHIAAGLGKIDIVNLLLLDERTELDIIDPHGWTPLHHAALNGQDCIVKLLMNERTKEWVLKKDAGGKTPLFYAVKRGHKDVVLTLLDGGTKEDSKKTNDGTILHLAVQYGHPDIVQLLVKRNFDCNALNTDGYTPLHLAAKSVLSCNYEIVKMLLDAGAGVNVKDKTGKTAQDYVSKRGSENLERLFKDKAEPQVRESDRELVANMEVDHEGE